SPTSSLPASWRDGSRAPASHPTRCTPASWRRGSDVTAIWAGSGGSACRWFARLCSMHRRARRRRSTWRLHPTSKPSPASTGTSARPPSRPAPRRTTRPLGGSGTRAFGSSVSRSARSPLSRLGQAEHRDIPAEDGEGLASVVGKGWAECTADIARGANTPQRVPGPQVVELVGETTVELLVEARALGGIGFHAAGVEQAVDLRVLDATEVDRGPGVPPRILQVGIATGMVPERLGLERARERVVDLA